MKKIIIAIVCAKLIGCASLKYPNWERVSIESSVINQPCESRIKVEEQCFNNDCTSWFKKRATIYGANTVVRHGDSASYFYCAAGLPPYQNSVNEAVKCLPKHDEEYLKKSRVNIKGYYLGMKKCEIEESLDQDDKSFSIIGIVVDRPMLEFIDNKLARFYVEIPTSMFYRLQSAIQAKYPGIECKNSIIHNRMNASFDQTECTLIFDEGNLSIKRYMSDTTKSSLSLISNEVLMRILIDEHEKQKDI